jgi:hypothetical protein
MSDEDALAVAPWLLHVENRRAKHLSLYERRIVYQAKNSFLVGAVLTGVVEGIETFNARQRAGYECCDCGRTWYGAGDECYLCGDPGEPVYDLATWYVVQIGGYRFHQPGNRIPPEATAAFIGAAVEVEPHDPHQDPREVPACEFSAAARLRIVERAAAVLLARSHVVSAQTNR